MILVSFENVKKCALDGCTITSKTKINVFWKIFRVQGARTEPRVKFFFQKTVDLSLWGNRATTRIHFSNYTFFLVLAHSAHIPSCTSCIPLKGLFKRQEENTTYIVHIYLYTMNHICTYILLLSLIKIILIDLITITLFLERIHIILWCWTSKLNYENYHLSK